MSIHLTKETKSMSPIKVTSKQKPLHRLHF